MSEMDNKEEEQCFRERCVNANHLHAWVYRFTGLNIPRQAICEHHQAPFDYLKKSYFEEASDLVVWAPRGGGKTRLAALATFLDLIHKPGCAVRILGGSLEQSLRMWEHLLPQLTTQAGDWIVPKLQSSRRLTLYNQSSAAVLTQSRHAVRGIRVQKLRCDEVEMFRPEIWEAAQLVTRSIPEIKASIEAISTMHVPGGLMSRIIDRATENHSPVIRWCLLEVLEKCPPQRDCASCPLWEDFPSFT
ncbi:MAG TPA: hypothetical protein VHD56_01030 [Tepidisphaeraceae bacterium]|nr:hypothetical protein [Tepidisphaeraceae bacterium]